MPSLRSVAIYLLKAVALVAFLALWLGLGFVARYFIRLLAAKIGLQSIPIVLYIGVAFVLLLPLAPVAEWVLNKIEKSRSKNV